jgi:hypothetical protein
MPHLEQAPKPSEDRRESCEHERLYRDLDAWVFHFFENEKDLDVYICNMKTQNQPCPYPARLCNFKKQEEDWDDYVKKIKYMAERGLK